MVYEAQGMRLEPVRVVNTGAVNDILVCRNLDAAFGEFYTVLVIKEHKMARRFLKIYAEANRETEIFLMGCGSGEGQFVAAFPYKKERPLDEFYVGESYSLAECEEICISTLLTCISAGIPHPILYLLLKQRQLNLARDNTIYLGYQVDLTGLNPKIGERECVVECARILSRLLAPKEHEKAMSYRLLQKKIRRSSYDKFTELYKDIRIAAAPKTKHGFFAILYAWFYRSRDRLFAGLSRLCLIMVLFVAVSFLTQVIFGNIPWMKLFFNGFQHIGTESLLQ